MAFTVSQWPFLPEEQRTPEQNERWWAECYVPSPADVTLHGRTHSVIAAGSPGSGKSVALRWFERVQAEQLLLVRYPVARWPGEPHAWTADYGHLGQIMACISMVIKKLLDHQPEKIESKSLSETNLEYLRWLIEKYTGRRSFYRWADTLNHQPLLDLVAEPFDDIYPTDVELLDVQGQIEELVTLSRRLGFDGVVVLVDVNESEIDNELVLVKVEELFGWLTPLQFEGFAIKAALPEKAVEQARLINRSRGRISFTSLCWSTDLCRQLSNRLIRAASNRKLTDLAEIASVNLLAELESELQALYGAPSPRAWACLTRILLTEYIIRQRKKLTIRSRAELIHSYFATFVSLRIDKARRGVWRGEKFILLDEQPFSFLETLWLHRGSGDANEALLRIAGTQGNLNTIASRLRKKIEPVPHKPIYIQNSRSQGYWLENFDEM